MALSLNIRIGGSLWSAVAWNRYGSPFRYSGDDGRKPTALLVPEVCRIFRRLPKRFQATALQSFAPIHSKIDAIALTLPLLRL